MGNYTIELIIDAAHSGKRLDQVLAELIPEHSRSRLQGWVKSGEITVNNQTVKQRTTVHTNDQIRIDATYNKSTIDLAEAIPLDIVYEDETLILINKPAGLVVHPGAGNPDNTLVNALLNHDSQLERLPRAGIVHRLDKDTTGIMLVARTPQAHTNLVEQMQFRKIQRHYQAVVCGNVTAGNTINTNLGRHPSNRKRMAVVENGKVAITHYRLIRRFGHYTHLRVNLETGRTHQIRVHMAYVNHPLVGDPVYGKNQSFQKGINALTRETVSGFTRQALHAYELHFQHPATQQTCQYKADIPNDFQCLIEQLAEHDRV